MRAPKRPCARKIGRRRGFTFRHHTVLAHPNIGVWRLYARDSKCAWRARARFQSRINVPAVLIVNADQRDLSLRDKALLDRGVARKIAMPIEMVGRDVNQEPDTRREGGSQIDLIGRTLDNMRAPSRGRRQIQNGHADVAAHRDFAPGLLKHMSDKRRGR